MHYRVPKDTVMTPEVLTKYINLHRKDVKRNRRLEDAYENDYQIFRGPKKPDYKPDIRISANFAKYLTDTFTGFFCGIPIKISSADEQVNDLIMQLSAYNNEDDHNLELAKGSSIHGDYHELLYVDEESQLCYTEVSPLESFFLVDDSMLSRPLYFVRYYKDSENVVRGSWADASVIQYFTENPSVAWDDEPHIHGFDGVPAVEYMENKEHMGIFESQLSEIDAYNKALSEKANDVDYFGDAYLAILGAEVKRDEMPVVRRNRLINFKGNSGNKPDVFFLEKPSADSTQENLLNRLEKLIFLTSMIADVSDENFAGNASGVALKYKLLAMQNLATFKALKFQAAMNRRYKLLFSNPLARINKDSWTKIDYKFTMNYPANIESEATVAKDLEGVTSKETQLKVLSVVDDPKAEMERIAEEDSEAMNRMTQQGAQQE